MRPVPPFLARSTSSAAQTSVLPSRSASPLSGRSRSRAGLKKPLGYYAPNRDVVACLTEPSLKRPGGGVTSASKGFFYPAPAPAPAPAPVTPRAHLHSSTATNGANVRQSDLGLGLYFWGLIGALGLGAAGLTLFGPPQFVLDTVSDMQQPQQQQQQQPPTSPAPGRPGNLTAEQEEKLRRLWQLVMQVCGVEGEEKENGTAAAAATGAKLEQQSTTTSDTKKSKFGGIFTRRGKRDSVDLGNAEPASPTTPTTANGSLGSLSWLPWSPGKGGSKSGGGSGDDDKYGQTQQFYKTLASQTPESIRSAIWTMVKHDHPDALLLRFLRARKWDVEKALAMFISTMNWRHSTMRVDDDIMRTGEGGALALENGAGSAGAAGTTNAKADATDRRRGHDFLQQIRMGKSFVHGVDRQGRPICIVRTRFHKPGEQLKESLERYTVYLIETCRMLLRPPVDTASIVFDLTDFKISNMDYGAVEFMIKCFQANYPECLGAVLVHNAPDALGPLFDLFIRPWLDPVVASKIHFTKYVRDLDRYIPRAHIPKELGGDEDWTYQYYEPVPGEDDTMRDTATRDTLLAARELLYKQYESATLEWIRAANQGGGSDRVAQIKARREEIAVQLREGYWQLDPYVRARSYYDRTGILLPGGGLQFYPAASSSEEEEEEKKAVVSTAATATATDAKVNGIAGGVAAPLTAVSVPDGD